VAAVKKNNVPVEYVIFPDEGHGFVKKENEIKGYGAVLKFLDQHLKGEQQPKKKIRLTTTFYLLRFRVIRIPI